jgi:Tfp pilus assembly protein PilV
MVKLKGSTLLESVVAMLIISIIIGIAFMIFGNIITNDSAKTKISASILINNYYSESVYYQEFIPADKWVGNYQLSRDVNAYKRIRDLNRLTITVSTKNGIEILKKHFLILDE